MPYKITFSLKLPGVNKSNLTDRKDLEPLSLTNLVNNLKTIAETKGKLVILRVLDSFEDNKNVIIL